MADEEKVVNQLRHHSRCAFDFLYKTYYPVIAKFITANHGSEEDAKDIFQETLLVFSKNMEKKDFQLTSSLKTYLYAISKNLWLKSLRNRKPTDSLESKENEYAALSDTSAQEQENEMEITDYIDRLMAKMPVHCQKIVQYVYYQNLPVDKVVQALGYNNNHTASNVKYKCIQQMKRTSESISFINNR